MIEKEEWEKIRDESKTKFDKVTDKGLVQEVSTQIGNSPISVNVEMMRRLKNEIERFNVASSKYSRIIISLTIVLTILALIQIYLLLK